jgi:hypothetical protein
VDWFDDPIDAGIAADGLVLGIDENDFVVLVGGVLVDPVGIEDAEVGATAANTFFGGGSKRALVFELVHTLVGGFAYSRNAMSALVFLNRFPISHTVCSTLWHWPLAASTANADTVDNITLLGLVSEAASFVGARWS